MPILKSKRNWPMIKVSANAIAQHLLPYRNIRHLLSIHAKTHGTSDFLLTQTDDGTIQRLDYAEFNARVHQAANLLHDDLGVQRGDRVAMMSLPVDTAAILYGACWIIGACAVPLNPHDTDIQLTQVLDDVGATIWMVGVHDVNRATAIHDQLKTSRLRGIVTVGEAAVAPYPHFDDLVKNLPNTYLGDGAPVKSDDDTIKPATQATASLQDEAFMVYRDQDYVALTQARLLTDAWLLASAQGISGGHKLLSVLSLDTAESVVVSMIMPLLAGASTMVLTHPPSESLWRTIIRERVHLAHLNVKTMKSLLEAASAQPNNVFGEGIHRRGLSRFRHFLCSVDGLEASAVRDFEDTFGFLVQNITYQAQVGFFCLMPITLSWDDHQHWTTDGEALGIGTALPFRRIGIFDSSRQELGPDVEGEVFVRGTLGLSDMNTQTALENDWVPTGCTGYYFKDADARRYYFITSQPV
jgi:acyl-CoA synthetase (AMP-forming)/AMP-acid ligase II